MCHCFVAVGKTLKNEHYGIKYYPIDLHCHVIIVFALYDYDSGCY